MFKRYLRRTAGSIVIISQALLFSSCEKDGGSAFICTDPLGCVTVRPDAPIHLGVLQAISGAVSPLGEAQIRGLELALDKHGGMILGHPVRLQVEDTGCTPEGGANAALRVIANPQTVAIFGTTCSAAAATASQAMSDAGLTMISGNNSAPFLTSIGGKAAPDWHPGYFRTAANEENAGRVAAEYAYAHLGVRRAAVIHDGDIYTMGLAGSFREGFEKMGGNIVLYTAINKGDTEMRPVLSAVVEAGAELLFFPLFQPEGNRILKQARINQRFDDLVMMSDGALIQESFLKDVGELATGMYFIGPAKPQGPAVAAVAARYQEKYQESPSVSYYLSGYDAADILFEAIESTAVREEDGTLHIGRKALRDSLYTVSGKEGITGTFTCSQYGDCAEPVFNVLRLDDPGSGLQGLENNILFSSGSEDKL